ncbi:FHA domain-containing protein [Epidermidibacterium keratini]|uniref:FHA domain-containing protein n=1 Tax=Epidermidibacterium keratini TaxID=1891644 RepID=A0A7L4YTB3_9ACTN|nr:FHA domain-containing protein [Epidermidibacterium keratini]QHC02164.1 FHA domain-containing protein [Epidermidibacterium keratini]
MKCKVCNAELSPGARFCAQCGAPTGVSDTSLPAGETTRQFSPVGNESEPAEAPESTEAPHEDISIEGLPADTALLVVKRGPNAGSRFLLDQEVTTAGRHPKSDIFLDDVTVSRRHVEFRRDGEDFSVSDVGSLNGTYLNREPIDQAVLASGDEVQIGKFRLVFLVGHRNASQGTDAAPTGAGS